jgi:hypothetical protein
MERQRTTREDVALLSQLMSCGLDPCVTHDVHVNNHYYGGGGGGGNKNNNHNNNVNVNVNKNNTFNKNTVNARQQTWEHNPDHRRSVAYRDPKTSQRFESHHPSATRERQAQQQARGYDRGEGGGTAGSSAKPATADRGGGSRAEARPTNAATGGRQDAFKGYGNGPATRESSQRGASSRGTQSWAGGGGGTKGATGHAGSGGGGGGSRGGSGGGGGKGGKGGGRGRRR